MTAEKKIAFRSVGNKQNIHEEAGGHTNLFLFSFATSASI